MLETPWGRTKLCVSDEAWELAAACVLDDPQGILEASRLLVHTFLSRPEALLTKMRAGSWELRMLMRRLTKMASTADRAGRANGALALTAGIYALSAREQYSGVCGLSLRVLHYAAGQYPRQRGLWTTGRRVARWLGLLESMEPLRGIRLAHGIRPDWGADQLKASAVKASEIALQALAQTADFTPSDLEALGCYYRALISEDPEDALMLMRGETARNLRTDVRYLVTCGLMPESGEGKELADAWPELLARLSAALSSGQAVVSLCNRLTAELVDMTLAAAAKDDEDGPPTRE